MKNAFLIGSALSLTLVLAACDRREAASPEVTAPTAPATVPAASATAVPMRYETATPYAEVELTLPPSIAAHPTLHGILYQTLVRDLRQFNEGAQADRTEAGAEAGPSPYSKTITVEPAAETRRLVSLMREDYEFTGGAHGNTISRGILWDKTNARQVQPSALFRSDADLSSLDAVLCRGVNAEKRRRDAGAELVRPGGSPWTCPRAAETPFVLAAGPDGRAAGLTFLIGPYVVGPYAEGGYEVRVPTSALTPLLSPNYAGEFG